jgi:hypothetical protein
MQFCLIHVKFLLKYDVQLKTILTFGIRDGDCAPLGLVGMDVQFIPGLYPGLMIVPLWGFFSLEKQAILHSSNYCRSLI